MLFLPRIWYFDILITIDSISKKKRTIRNSIYNLIYVLLKTVQIKLPNQHREYCKHCLIWVLTLRWKADPNWSWNLSVEKMKIDRLKRRGNALHPDNFHWNWTMLRCRSNTESGANIWWMMKLCCCCCCVLFSGSWRKKYESQNLDFF